MRLRRSFGIKLRKQNVLQRSVSKLLNEPPYGRQNQTNRGYMFRKTSAIKTSYNFWLTFAMIHGVEIAILFLRLEREQIGQILLDLEQLTSGASLIRKAAFKARGTRFSCREAALLATNSRLVFVPRSKFINLFKNIAWECKEQIFRRRCAPEGNLVESIWQFYCLLKKKQITLARAHNRDTVPLSLVGHWGISLTYSKKRRGLKMETWGTPKLIVALLLSVAFPRVVFAVFNLTLHDWLRFV